MQACGRVLAFTVVALLLSAQAAAQTRTAQIQPILDERLISKEVVKFQLGRYLIDRVPNSPSPATAETLQAGQFPL